MKGICILFFAALSSAAAASDSLVTNLVVRQRTPWSNVVDIDYIYTGSCPTSMTYTATWDGQSTPVGLVTLTSSGVNVEPGPCLFTWDPSEAGYGKSDLKNFKIQISPVAKDPRTYLIVNLENGGYTTMADVPTGGWTDEYKTTKMVFRRIPAGTYQLGYPHTNFYAVAMTSENGTTRPIAQSGAERTSTLSSDFYFQVFVTTTAQASYIFNWATKNSTKAPSNFYDAYELIRGDVLDDGVTVVDWPNTGYAVKSTSWVGSMRSLCGGLLLDLPTDDQWEIAMRAGTTTFMPNGEPSTYSYETWDPYFRELFWNAATSIPGGKTREKEADPLSKEVGLKSPNRWGIYDFNLRAVPVLDWANDKKALNSIGNPNLDFPPGGVDRIGPTNSIHNVRVLRGGSATGPTWCPYNYTVTVRSPQATNAVTACNFRFAIHLKPLTKIE